MISNDNREIRQDAEATHFHRHVRMSHGIWRGGMGVVFSGLGETGLPAPIHAFSWGGGPTMVVTSITWTVAVAGITLLALTLLAQTSRHLRAIRYGAMGMVAVAAVLLVTGQSSPSTTVDITPTVIALATGLIVILFADYFERRNRRHLGATDTVTARMWDRLSRTISRAESLDRLLLTTAGVLRDATGAREAVVYKLARNGRETIHVGSTSSGFDAMQAGSRQDNLAALAKRCLADRRVAVYQRGTRSGRSTGDAWGMIPLHTEKTVYGAILLERPRVSLREEETARTLTTAGMLIGRTVEDWLGSAVGAHASKLMTKLPNLLTDLSGQDSFERGLPMIAKALQGIVETDFISLAWMDRARYHEDRACMVVGEQRILDSRRRWPVWESTTRRLFHMDRPLITPDLTMISVEEDGFAQPLEQRLGFRSRIVMPIRDEDRLIGCLTLAHRHVAFYGEDEARPLSLMVTAIGAWLKRLESTRAARQFRDAASLAIRVEEDPLGWSSDSELLKYVLPGIGTTGLRLYRLSADRKSLELAGCAGRTTRLPETHVVDTTPKPLARAPWHRWSLADGAPHRINQSDPEALMDADEADSTMIPGMKTGWIVPIRHAGETLGFLDAMEVRDPDRCTTSEPEQVLLEATANALAQRWTSVTSDVALVPRDEVRKRLTALNGTIVNPITGIIGSVELIRHKQSGLTGETAKYLNLIEHAATRIHKAVLNSLELTNNGTSESAGERSEAVARRLFGALAISNGNGNGGGKRDLTETIEPVANLLSR